MHMDIYDKYVGRVLDRRYRIIRIIGVGGMAVVFEAIDTVMKRSVAVKMLKEEMSNDAQAVKRFVNESRAVSMLSHPNIVSIYDVAVRDDLKYIVMERVDGITLKNYMNQHGPLPTRELLKYSAQILRALEHAHSKEIIHRDIKPQNIMLIRNGNIKVADFGIAKLPSTDTVTVTDKAIGTVYYISPEQASGKPIDNRSDLYSLGVMMYEMATGALPFIADSPVSVALMQVNNNPKPPREIIPSIPVGLEKIIMTAMNKDPGERFQNAAQMLHCIKLLQRTLSVPGKGGVYHLASPENALDTALSSMHNTSQRSGDFSSVSTGEIPKKRFGRRKRRKRTQDDENAPKRQNRSMFPIISGVVTAFLLVLGISAAYILTQLITSSEADAAVTVEIPQLAGSLYSEELRAQLDEKNYYNIIIEEIYDSDFEMNYIISQEPLAGEKRKVKAGEQYTDLTLQVSRGARTVEVGDYLYLDNRKVKIEIQASGLMVELIGEHSDTVVEGFVTRTVPEAGATLNAGETVTVYYSLGPEIQYVTVPDFYNVTETQTMIQLEELGLQYGNITYEHSDTVAKGRIISQNRVAYTEVPIYVTKIDFVVSLGPKE